MLIGRNTASNRVGFGIGADFHKQTNNDLQQKPDSPRWDVCKNLR